MFQPHYRCMEYIRNSWAVHLYAQNLASEQKKKKEREREIIKCRGQLTNTFTISSSLGIGKGAKRIKGEREENLQLLD